MRRLFPPQDLATVLAHDVVADEPGGTEGDRELADADLVREYGYPATGSWLRVNMVSSLDGVASVEGRSEGLSGAADKRIFAMLRGLADVVLVGAGTARAENYGGARVPEWLTGLRDATGQAPVPPIAVLSRSLRLDPAARLFTETAVRPIVITCTSAPGEARAALAEVADVVDAGTDRVEPAAARAALEERGFTRLLCEGGPTFLHELVEAGVVDELCLTLSPQLVGGGDRHVLHGPPLEHPQRLRLAALLEDEGDLFARYLAEH